MVPRENKINAKFWKENKEYRLIVQVYKLLSNVKEVEGFVKSVCLPFVRILADQRRLLIITSKENPRFIFIY